MIQIPTFTGKGKNRKLKIYKLLMEFGELNSQQILNIINQNSRQGMTMNEMSSTLASMTKHIKKVGYCDYQGSNCQSRIRCIIWGINYES